MAEPFAEAMRRVQAGIDAAVWRTVANTLHERGEHGRAWWYELKAEAAERERRPT